MDRPVRYEILSNVEDEVVAVTVPEEAAAAPELSVDMPAVMPPSYECAANLPTYEEAERSKAEEAAASRSTGGLGMGLPPPRYHLDDSDATSEMVTMNDESIHGIYEDIPLGTDCAFLCTFAVCFFFNWIGLLACMCFIRSIAGRFGALSGFGLSLVKWVVIIKQSNWAGEVSESDAWLWWLLVVVGCLIFFRGCTQYLRLKHQWHHMTAAARQRVYMYF